MSSAGTDHRGSPQGGKSPGKHRIPGVFLKRDGMYDPVIFPPNQWNEIARNMRGKAKLREHEFEDMQVFVRSIQ
jgi:hypothetical protein